MGVISSLKQSKFLGVTNSSELTSPTDSGLGRDLWRRVFGAPTNKEEGLTEPAAQRPVPGGSWGRSNVGTTAAVERLIQALRSRAPGGWSDDRWEETMRHYYGIVYIAIFRKAILMQQAEFKVLRKVKGHPEGKVEVMEGEPGYELVQLMSRPNHQDSFGKWLFRCSQQKELTGTSLTWLLPNMIMNKHPSHRYRGLGTPFEMYNIPTAIAIPQPVINPDYPDGYYRIQPVYPYGPFSSFPVPNSAVGAPIGGEWMMKFQYPHPLLRYDGYSPLTGMREHVDGLQSIDRSRWYKMKKTIRPNAVLQMENFEGAEPLPFQEIERLRSEIEAAFSGPENVGNLFVASPGTRLEEFGVAPADMDYPTGWEQLTSFILGAFGISKPAAGMVEDNAYATLFANLKQVHVQTIQPELDDVANEITHFLAPFFGPDLIVEIRAKRIDDHEIKANQMGLLIQSKAITKNEMRKKCEELGLDVTPEAWGNDIAGDPSPAEIEMQQQAAMPMMDASGAPIEEGLEGEYPEQGEDAGEYLGDVTVGGDEIEGARPLTGGLDTGSLGPRKSLNGHTKRFDWPFNSKPKRIPFMQRIRKAWLNGHSSNS